MHREVPPRTLLNGCPPLKCRAAEHFRARQSYTPCSKLVLRNGRALRARRCIGWREARRDLASPLRWSTFILRSCLDIRWTIRTEFVLGTDVLVGAVFLPHQRRMQYAATLLQLVVAFFEYEFAVWLSGFQISQFLWRNFCVR